MEDLIEFLRARLDDDEAYARQAFADHNDAGPDWIELWSGSVQVGEHEDLVEIGDSGISRHIVRHDPARVLREVEAKRRIIGLLTDPDVYDEDDNPVYLGGYGEAYVDAVRLLALPYCDHSDYREEWRP